MLSIAVIIIWIIVGTKLSFAALTAPTVFQVLAPSEAGIFLRRLFPKLYLWCSALSFASAVFLMIGGAYPQGFGMMVIGIFHGIARGPLTHKINESRDADLAGIPEAKERFDRLHKLSVRLFMVQLIGCFACALSM